VRIIIDIKMDAAAVQYTLFQAVAFSSLPLPHVTSQDRQAAFRVLQEFAVYPGRIALALSWLNHAQPHTFENHDITTAIHLLSLQILTDYLSSKQYHPPLPSSSTPSAASAVVGYANAPRQEQTQFRQAIAQVCCRVASQPWRRDSIVAKKLASLWEQLLLREFPQRWPEGLAQLVVPQSQGGLLYNTAYGPSSVAGSGVHMICEVWRLLAEDCTDADFNAKLSTSRRNDVLLGLNEVAHTQIVPHLFSWLEHLPLLTQCKERLHQMHTFLLQQQRTVSSLTPDERTQYDETWNMRDDVAQIMSDALLVIKAIATYMPVSWLLEGPADFAGALLHLWRIPDADIHVHAVTCIEQLVNRGGKLESAHWWRFINEIPIAISQSNVILQQEFEQLRTQQLARRDDVTPDLLTWQFEWHRGVSRCMAATVCNHIALIGSPSNSAEQKQQIESFLRLMSDYLKHPSGRLATDQLNAWTTLLRDPQTTKSRCMTPLASSILDAFMHHMVRLRWDDVENEVHPHFALMEASYDDEEEYEAWMADLRSRSSQLFKFLGNMEPDICAQTLRTRIESLLAKYGQGDPRDHLNTTNQQLTQDSEAVIQFEALYQPLDNVLHGIPSWALDESARAPKDCTNHSEVLRNTHAALREVANAIVSWNPHYLWLKFRRATLLDALRHYWKHNCEPSSLLQAVDSLLKYLGLPDEWNSDPNSSMSGEIVSLKKKSGVTLVNISKKVPQNLVPWLSQLSEATKGLLSSHGLIPMNQMHLFEFLSCVATAVENPVARAEFIQNVLSNALETLESPEVQQSISSVNALLTMLGITQAGERPESVTNPNQVKAITGNYNRLFNALNRLLSVGKRCNEAARAKTINCGVGINTVIQNSASNSSSTPYFPDEGTISIQDLSINDPFAPLWPRILPTLLTITESILGVWRPENQAVLLQNRLQCYTYAISDDDAYLSKTQDGKSGGVFGEGGTAGSVVAGTDRRDLNLVPKWSGWFNELRNTCFQMLGLLCTERILYAPEIASMYPRLIAVLTDPGNLKSMEHRHFSQYLKHAIELAMISCPSTLYVSHLEPFIGPTFEHLQYRLEKTWAPLLGCATNEGCKALYSSNAGAAATLAAKGGENWYTWYYAHAGLFVGDLDSDTAEAAVEKHRVELTRNFSDVLQVAFALKGDWALVLANQAKEEQAMKRKDISKLSAGPRNRPQEEEGVQLNADGTVKGAHQDAIDLRKLARINSISHFLLQENERLAGSLTLTVIQCLGYPDAYTCRRVTRICHRILECVACMPQYNHLLGNLMFSQVVKNVVTEPKWMVGMEWDMINVARDIYCRMVLGQILLPGGQGAAQQMASRGDNQFEQAKTADRPLQGGGISTTVSEHPRSILASLPGFTVNMIKDFESDMKKKRSAKDQKDIIRDLLRIAADNVKEFHPVSSTGGAASSIFDRVLQEESLLQLNNRAPEIPDLPEKLVTHTQTIKKHNKANQVEPEGLAAFQL
jgi:hypothetical protein